VVRAPPTALSATPAASADDWLIPRRLLSPVVEPGLIDYGEVLDLAEELVGVPVEQLPFVAPPPPDVGLAQRDEYRLLGAEEADAAGDELEAVAQVPGVSGGQQAVLEVPVGALPRDPVEAVADIRPTALVPAAAAGERDVVGVRAQLLQLGAVAAQHPSDAECSRSRAAAKSSSSGASARLPTGSGSGSTRESECACRVCSAWSRRVSWLGGRNAAGDTGRPAPSDVRC
jgi:hypothetical protein